MSIRLGIDPVAGLNAPYILPAGVKDYLADFGMTQLAQVQNLELGTLGENYWYSATNLNLGVFGLISGLNILMVLHMEA